MDVAIVTPRIDRTYQGCILTQIWYTGSLASVKIATLHFDANSAQKRRNTVEVPIGPHCAAFQAASPICIEIGEAYANSQRQATLRRAWSHTLGKNRNCDGHTECGKNELQMHFDSPFAVVPVVRTISLDS